MMGFHMAKVMPYLKRNKCVQDTVVYIFTTGDEYIRRAFQRRGWVENPDPTSEIWDLRWDLNENMVPPHTNP